MGILNLPSKEPAKAEAEQDIDQAGQALTNPSPQLARVTYSRSEDERRFFGDFEVGADAEPIPIPTNSPHRDDMSGRVNIEGLLRPRNTLQSSPSSDAQRPARTFERLTGSKRMHTEAIRGDSLPHTEERWDLHSNHYPKRKKAKSGESIVISDDEMVAREDIKDVGRPGDTPHPTVGLGSETGVGLSSAMNGDVSEYRDVEKRMKASRGGKSSSAKINTGTFKFKSQELRGGLLESPSQPLSHQVEEISDDEVHLSPKPDEPYRGTSFLTLPVKRLDNPKPRQSLQNVKSMHQTGTKSAYFPPNYGPNVFGRLANSNTPTNSRDIFRRVGDADDSPDVLHNGNNVGIRIQSRMRDRMTTNGNLGPIHRSRSPSQESPLNALQSPSDILTTRFGSSKRKSETLSQATSGPRNNEMPQGYCFRLEKLIYGHQLPGLGDHEYFLRFDHANGDAKVTFECRCGALDCSEDLNCLAFSVMKVVKIDYGATMAQIMLSKEGNCENIYLLEFSRELETYHFVRSLNEESKCCRVLNREYEHMRRIFRKSGELRQSSLFKQHHLRSRPESRSNIELDQDADRIQHNKERQKLRRDDGLVEAQPTAKRRKSESSDRRVSVQPGRSREVGNSKDNIFGGNIRETRSKSRPEKISRDLGDVSGNQHLMGEHALEPQESKFFELKRLHKLWDKPLVFPADGPKKTTVDFGDLERLDEGEFLNDNIIAFYLRYLERDLEVTHPSIAKRIYFFNTFFYERLTSRSAGKKGINYEGVQKWTSRVDIFNFDYVVVPVNESLSRTLDREEEESSMQVESSDRKSGHQVQVVEPSSPNSPSQTTVADAIDLDNGVTEAGEQVARISLMQGETTEETGDLDSKYVLEGNSEKVSGTDDIEDESWPAADENPPISAADGMASIGQDTDHRVRAENASSGEDLPKARAKAHHKPIKGKKRPNLKKYGVDDPVIIILDSLGLTHSITARNLKEYLIEEGKSKRQLQVAIEDISAMNSKEIPLQDNFCDCGIYLLSYIEKFLKDPKRFVSGILRREMDRNSDWPDLNPSVKRDHLRKLLLDLYKEQNDARKREAIVRGKYHKGLRHAAHESEEGLSNNLVSRGAQRNQRKPELSETDHEASGTNAMAMEGDSKTHASGMPENSLIVVGSHQSEKQPDLSIEGGINRIELPGTAESQDDLPDLGLLLGNTARIRKDQLARVNASVEPAELPLTELTDPGKSPERYPRRTPRAHGAENTGLEVVVSPRRRARGQRSSPELGDKSIILD
ncbi:hypothetical protein FGG08_003784 [Glutinoglossum americanum]|uniref:Ubiquitin-like protease family profile domain-containing protein n=1 Tax=Glutinoglossum americanum TaxID=1670608 RepID=A0A9P8L093_9PEZI|nr:hypothetical protein FGG08_003784 [Glutinoglossum americanum]